MLTFRYSNDGQKQAQLAILRDLIMDHADDQLAKTVLSNAIGMAEATMVTGQLDAMMEGTTRRMMRANVGLSVFFALLFGFQIYSAFAWNWVHAASAFATLAYAVCIWVNTRIQRRYHNTLRWLEDMQLVAPNVPLSLTVVKH